MDAHLLLIYLTVIISVTFAATPTNSPFVWRSRYAMPWTRGPNMCAIQEVTGKGLTGQYYSECMLYKPRQICGKPAKIRYQCCNGYEKVGESRGCTGVVEMESLYQNAYRSGLNKFLGYVTDARLTETLDSQGPYTLFGVVDDGFRNMPRETHDRLNGKGPGGSLVKYHIALGRWSTWDMKNEMTLDTEMMGKKLRVNKYSNGIITINCARILVPNQVATNGIGHTVDKVLVPYDEQGTITDLIKSRSDLGEFYTALTLNRMDETLRGPGPFTVFAPTDAAFRKLPLEIVRMFADPNSDTMRQLINYHIVKNSLCSAALVGPAKLETVQGALLNMSCSMPSSRLRSTRIQVNGYDVVVKDLVASNGVVHIIDEVLVPDNVKSISLRLEEMGLTTFTNMLRTAGIEKKLQIDTGGSVGAGSSVIDGAAAGRGQVAYTLFVPSEEAWRDISYEQRSLWRQNPALLRLVLEYHMALGKKSSKDMVSQQVLSTASESSKSFNGIRVSIDRKGWAINSARVLKEDYECGNGMIHIVDRVMVPPSGSVWEILQNDERYSMFLTFLTSAHLDTLLSMEIGNFTLFAPTNAAFLALEQADSLSIERLTKILRYHILNKVVVTCGIRPNLTYNFKTDLGEWIDLSRSTYNEEVILLNQSKQNVTVIDYDVVGTNGVVYTIDKVLECTCPE